MLWFHWNIWDVYIYMSYRVKPDLHWRHFNNFNYSIKWEPFPGSLRMKDWTEKLVVLNEFVGVNGQKGHRLTNICTKKSPKHGKVHRYKTNLLIDEKVPQCITFWSVTFQPEYWVRSFQFWLSRQHCHKNTSQAIIVKYSVF